MKKNIRNPDRVIRIVVALFIAFLLTWQVFIPKNQYSGQSAETPVTKKSPPMALRKIPHPPLTVPLKIKAHERTSLSHHFLISTNCQQSANGCQMGEINLIPDWTRKFLLASETQKV